MMSKDRRWAIMEPVKIGPAMLKNRIVMPAMENLYNNPDGSVSEELIDYYAERARGGVGLIVIQNSHVDTLASRSAYCMLSIATGHMIAGLSRLADAIHTGGAKAVIQLGHGGRQCNPDAIPYGVQHVAPSPIPTWVWGVVPKELTIDEINTIQNAFVMAAERAKKAGLDGVEIHSAHGYLINQFISPLSNQRQDAYGGSLENRSRFALEIVSKMREKVGMDFIVGFRLSGDEYVPGGLMAGEGALYAKIVADTGKVDYISVSAATYESIAHLYPVMYSDKGSLLHLSEGVKKLVKNVPVIAVGAIDAEIGEAALREGKADLVAIGRGLLADPDIPNKIAAGKVDDIRPCIRCNEGCFARIADGKPMWCSVNPALGREKLFRYTPAGRRKKVIVIGGGLAGMEAARVAESRGHDVTLVENTGRLGGHLVTASSSPFKQPIKEFLAWEVSQIKKGRVKVRMNTEATPGFIKKAKPDAIIVAVGSQWNEPFKSKNRSVVSGEDVLSGKCEPGDKVVVIGGGTVGCETALDMAQVHKKKVTVVELLNQVMAGMELLNMIVLTEKLMTAGVEIRTGLTAKEINDQSVICEDTLGNRHEIAADTVVVCMGLKSRKDVADSFKGLAQEVYRIGDCIEARKISNAIEDAHRTAVQL
jgi:2,4-dienoyl-CoA reductase-like NADH-dependent reductase (Old Yellow Enzyme family)/thioredoxin reductase